MKCIFGLSEPFSKNRIRNIVINPGMLTVKMCFPPRMSSTAEHVEEESECAFEK